MTFYNLQFLRFVAALLVLLFHLTIISSGYKGVDIFFVISGFVMYYTLFVRKRPNAIHFVVNRTTKIFFLYWIAVLFAILVQPQKFNDLNLKTLILFPGHLSIVGVSWSLSFELYFYFVIGTSAYLIPSKYHKTLFIILLITTTLITFINLFTNIFIGTVINYAVGPNFWEFLLGILCAYLAINYYKRIGVNSAILMASISLLLFMIISIRYTDPLMFIVYGLLSFFTVLFLTSYEQERKLNTKLSNFFQLIGDASYGIYLFGPVITILINPKDNMAKILIIISTVVFSIVFNQLVENKFLMLTRRALYSKFPKQ